MSDEPAAIDVHNLRKRYGYQLALRGLDLTLRKGERVSLFGPNGAGKTTLIKILAHLLQPTSGEVRVLGVPVKEAGPEVRRQLGVISHQSFLYPALTATENLELYGRLFGVSPLGPRIQEVLTQVELDTRAHVPVATFSRGMTQRLSIARAIVHRPSIILLDEPYSGLDPHASRLLSALLKELGDGERTLLMTTHHLEEGLELSSRVCIQVGGRLVFDAPSQGLSVPELSRIYSEKLVEARAQKVGTPQAAVGPSGPGGQG